MSCYLFKVTRRVNGVPVKSHHWYGALKMPWDRSERRWCLGIADKREAEWLLHQERDKAEKRHYGRLPPEVELEAAERPLNELLEAFLSDLRSLGRTETTLKTYRNLLVLFGRCNWRRIGDVTERSFCEWRKRSKLAPRTLNSLLKNLCNFFRWLRRQRWVTENPLEFVRCVDTRRVENFRRPFKQEELQQFLAKAPHERAVVYLTAANTGLRRNEMQQLTVADLVLDCLEPYLVVRASIAKHPKQSRIRLLPEVVDAIRTILPDLVPPSHRVFAGLIPRIPTFKKDLKNATIEFLDAHGRRLDFHSLRDTYGTNLALGGVSPWVLKELMRHSTVQQAERYYIDAKLLPLGEAVAKLPKFRLPDCPISISKAG